MAKESAEIEAWQHLPSGGKLFGKPNAGNIERVIVQRSNGALSFYSRNNFR